MEAMASKTTGVVCLSVIGIGISAFIYLRNKKPRQRSQPRKRGAQCKVLFFNHEGWECYLKPGHIRELNCPVEDCPSKHLRAIKAALKSAKSSIDVCLYNFTHLELETTLVNLIHSGVKVRCVYGSRNGEDREFVKKLRANGAFLREKDHAPPPGIAGKYKEVSDLLMHHKFIIVDKKFLITGSMNWTASSFTQHWDHMIITNDQYLIHQFAVEFEDLFESRDRAETVFPCAQRPYQACFFRKDGILCRDDANRHKECDRPNCIYPLYWFVVSFKLLPLESLDICAQQLTLEDLARQIISLHRVGVKVRVICDKHFSRGTGSQIQQFVEKGIPVHYQDGPGTLHHKFIILDGKTLMSGSLNWTMQSFFGNYENILFITDKDVVSTFQCEFEKLWVLFSPTVVDS